MEAFLRFLQPLQVEGLREQIAEAESSRARLQELISLADAFNNGFAARGWIVSNSIDATVIEAAVATLGAHGPEAAEQVLVSYYAADTVDLWMNRLWAVPAFRIRWELLESALDDYRNARLYACVPQLLMVLDGAVSDLNGNRGFFTDTEDLLAAGSFVGHTGGLNMLKRAFGGTATRPPQTQSRCPTEMVSCMAGTWGTQTRSLQPSYGRPCLLLESGHATWRRKRTRKRSR
jgi:hypothetical protein